MTAPDRALQKLFSDMQTATGDDLVQLEALAIDRYEELTRGGVTPGALPYPSPTDPVAEGASAIRALAEAIESQKRWYFKTLPDGDYTNTAAIGTPLILPALPAPSRVKIDIAGVIGYSSTPNVWVGLNVPVTGYSSYVDTQGNTQINVVSAATWASYSRFVYADFAAGVAPNIAVTFSVIGAQGHFKGQMRVHHLLMSQVGSS